MHISPYTVTFLQALGHDAIRISEILPSNSSDRMIVETARKEHRVVLTQDLDFSEIISLSGESTPSLISLRLSSSRIEFVNSRLEKVLPQVSDCVAKGAIVVVEDNRIRVRNLPVQKSLS